MKSPMVILFGVVSFLASLLLFSVEPMIGKMALPVFGGTPAVWNTCLVFFQATLFGGYLLSYGMGRIGTTGPRRISTLYLATLAALLALAYLLLPIVFDRGVHMPSRGDAPALVLLGLLARTAALPLILISATAPLAQGWFALTSHRRSGDPYFLYAASNGGSLLALLAYPFAIEPNLGLTAQSHLWKAGFLIAALLIVACGMAARRSSRSRSVMTDDDDGDTNSRPAASIVTGAVRLRWLLLVFIPSTWLMGVTTYLTTDLASIPLMWIIPLALYLLSFILAFALSAHGILRVATWSLPFLVVPVALVMSAGFVHLIWIPLHLATFFAGSLACHGALAELRPPPRFLSQFYVSIALGGLVGGIWSALVAPLVFDRVVEYPLAMVLACLAALGTDARSSSRPVKERLWDVGFAAVVFLLAAILATNRAGLGDSVLGVIGTIVASGMGILSCMTAQRRSLRFALVIAAVFAAGGLSAGVSGRLLHIERGFFGVLRVTHDDERNLNRLFHGSTLHGQQSLDPSLRREPSTYFTRSGPVGSVFAAMKERLSQRGARVAIVGLGAGTLATYAASGQRWTFYELDAAVERIARDPLFFTFLRDCEADAVDVVLGDARHRLQDAPDGAYELIVLDAFSSDALPVHLLSREAIRLYRAKLAAGGMLLFNLSNRYLDLDPVIGRQASDAGMVCRVCYDVDVSDEEKRAGKQPSIWAVITATENGLDRLAAEVRWQPPALRAGSWVWTDDYSDLASYLLLTSGQRGRRGRSSAVMPHPN